MTSIRREQIPGFEDDYGNTVVGLPQMNGTSRIDFNAKNCSVTFDDKVQFFGVITFRAENSSVHIGHGTSFRGHSSLGHGCAIKMGTGIYTGSDLQMTTAEGTSITLGDGLLIANHCRIRADDSHPIYDGVSGSRLNQSQSIVIGDHVWLGQDSFVMPGATVGSGSVVGARSIVTKSKPIPSNSLAIGSPAKVQRRNIVWVRKHLQHDAIDDSIDPVFDDPSAIDPEIKPGFFRSLTRRGA